MKESRSTVTCPHCGAENPRSLIVTLCRECGRALQEGTGPAPIAETAPVSPTPTGSSIAPEPQPELPYLALPPRDVPWSLQCEALFGGVLNQAMWFFLGAFGAGACLFVATNDVLYIAFDVSRVQIVEGTVTSVRKTGFADDDTEGTVGWSAYPIWAFRYRFVTPDGKPHGGRSYKPIGRGLPVGPKPGETVTVEYLRGHPPVSRIQGMRSRPWRKWGPVDLLVFVFLTPVSVSLTAVLVGLRRRLKVYPLLGRGQLAEGTVASRRASAAPADLAGIPRAIDPRRFTYVFHPQDGEVRTITRTVNLTNSPRERVAVLYDQRNPRRAMLLSEMLQRFRIGPRGDFESRWPPYMARLAPWLAVLPAFASLVAAAGLALALAQVYTEPPVEPPVEPTLPTLHEAASSGDAATVKLLIEQGAQADARDDTGWTALDHAVRGGHAGIVEFLLEHHADVRGGATFGTTALHHAAWFGSTGVAETLLHHGADVNARNQVGATPLHLAARRGGIEVAKLLLGQGADVNAKDNEGKSPLEWALVHHQAGMAQFLRAHGARKTGPSAQR